MEITDKETQFAVSPTILPDDNNLFVFVGANNSGKSTLLRAIADTFSGQSYLVNVNRTVLDGEGPLNKGYQNSYTGYIGNVIRVNDDNHKPSTQSLQDFFSLKDAQRTPIIEWYNEYFPNKIYEEQEDPENKASAMLLKINGHSITKQGSGMRSTLEIFVKLFDPSIKYLCIDEPELGLEPMLQKDLFRAIKDKASKDKKIFLCTHSHHFLDYDVVGNNFVCGRNSEEKITITAAVDLKQIIFRLLGNSLSNLLLPDNILVLEGVSDTTFLNKCLKLLGKNAYAVHPAGSDSSISSAVGAITQFLRLNAKELSVYADRVFVIADRQVKDILVREWKNLLPNPANQLKELSKNGIEHYYPEKLLQSVFSSGDSKDVIVNSYLKANPNGYNGKLLAKTELAKKISEKITAADLDDKSNELFTFLKALP